MSAQSPTAKGENRGGKLSPIFHSMTVLRPASRLPRRDKDFSGDCLGGRLCCMQPTDVTSDSTVGAYSGAHSPCAVGHTADPRHSQGNERWADRRCRGLAL